VRVLGIDPGLARTGYALVERSRDRLHAEALGVVTTEPTDSQADRLAKLRTTLLEIIARHHPDVVAVERLFFNANAKTAMAVGQSSGVVLATAAESGLGVTDYTPLEVKQSVVGYGGASKRQVQSMVAALLRLDQPPKPPDAADACALAICHLNRAGLRRAIERAVR
jgi:crossover junction endodeoxyribonuclease RuvC